VGGVTGPGDIRPSTKGLSSAVWEKISKIKNINVDKRGDKSNRPAQDGRQYALKRVSSKET